MPHHHRPAGDAAHARWDTIWPRRHIRRPNAIHVDRHPADHAGRIARLDQLAALDYGWHDGYGHPIHHDAIAWARYLIDTLTEHGFALPELYPTYAGGIDSEWHHNHISVSVLWDPHEPLLEVYRVETIGRRDWETSEHTIAKHPHRCTIDHLAVALRPQHR